MNDLLMDTLLFLLYGIVFLLLVAGMVGYTYFTAKMRTEEAEERQRQVARGIPTDATPPERD